MCPPYGTLVFSSLDTRYNMCVRECRDVRPHKSCVRIVGMSVGVYINSRYYVLICPAHTASARSCACLNYIQQTRVCLVLNCLVVRLLCIWYAHIQQRVTCCVWFLCVSHRLTRRLQRTAHGNGISRAHDILFDIAHNFWVMWF